MGSGLRRLRKLDVFERAQKMSNMKQGDSGQTGKQKNRHQRPKGGNVAARRERQKAEERQVMEVPAVGTPGDGAPRPALVPSPPPTQRAQTERVARSPRARGTHPDKAVAVSSTLALSPPTNTLNP